MAASSLDLIKGVCNKLNHTLVSYLSAIARPFVNYRALLTCMNDHYGERSTTHNIPSVPST